MIHLVKAKEHFSTSSWISKNIFFNQDTLAQLILAETRFFLHLMESFEQFQTE